MNGRLIRKWGPSLIVFAALAVAAAVYRDPLLHWFMPSETEVGVVEEATSPDRSASEPASQPASQPVSQPASQPASMPSSQPASMPSVHIDEGRRQLIGVKTARVERRGLEPAVRAVGRVTYDETRVSDVTLKLRAWIGEVHADFTGKEVRRGEPLFTIYAPELYSAQAEYLEALRQSRGDSGRGARLLEAARTRLRLWDVADSVIEQLESEGRPQKYVPMFSPASGTVIEKNIFEGSAVEPGTLLYRIADLSTVWIEAEVYEADLARVETGQTAMVTSAYLPGLRVEGEITYIYPYLDAPTRTGRVRIIADNDDGKLKPEMYVNVEVRTAAAPVLAVPQSAVIYAGDRRVAFRDLGDGRLQPLRVETGISADGWIEIRSGLDEGDRIVTDANFLVAAESNLSEALKTW